MPKPSKRPKDDSDSDTSDSGPEDRTPAKGASSSKKSPAKRPKGDPNKEGEEPTWSLGKMKQVKVRVFKGNTYVDIREYYVDKNTMETKPGRKGISLNCQQYQELKAVLSEVDQFLP